MPFLTFFFKSTLHINQEVDTCYRTNKQATIESSTDYVLKGCLYVYRLRQCFFWIDILQGLFNYQS